MIVPSADLDVSALSHWLAGKLGGADLRIVELIRHVEGWSWRTYTLDAEWTDPHTGQRRRRGFALRVEPVDGLLAPYDIAGQFRLHQVVCDRSAVPVPKPYWLEPDPAVLGTPFFVMDRARGSVPVQWRGDDPDVFPTAAARRRIGLEFVDVLARIHGIDWHRHGLGFLGEPADAGAAAAAQVERWADYYATATLVELPVVRRAIAWLRHNVATSGKLALCHGDYRIGNFMVRGGHIVAVFDWELAHISDPVEDIAYAGLPLFRGRNPMLSQLLAPEEFFARYRERTGLRVDREVFHFWTVCGLVKATAAHVRAVRAYEDGRAADVRLAAMGHQSLYALRHLATALDGST